ncbi:MAG: hypothetical protein GY810_04965 [Aureispira sp.]|nr:hypothetical protein [Aureispira sp.]
MACKKCKPYLKTSSCLNFDDLEDVFDITIQHQSSPVCEEEVLIVKGQGRCRACKSDMEFYAEEQGDVYSTLLVKLTKDIDLD